MKTKKIKKVFKKGFFVSLILMVFFQPLISNAANLFNLVGNPSPTTADINKGILTPITPNDANSEASGVLNKSQNPQVTVVFDRVPQAGQQVTATAMQAGFDVSGNRDLYYTWYIKHANDDGDTDSDRKRWKREAAGIMARGNFEANDINSKGDIYNGKNTEGKGYAAVPRWGKSSADDQNCYMRSYSTGRLYEITSNGTKFNCPVGYEAKCAESKRFNESQYQGAWGLPPESPLYPSETSCTFPNPDYCEYDATKDVPIPRSCTLVSKYKVNNDITNTCVARPGGVKPECITVDSQNFATKAVCPNPDYNPVCVPIGARIFNSGTIQADVCKDFGLSKKDGGCATELPILYNSQVEPPTYEPYPMLGSDGKTIPDEPVKCVKYRGGNKCEHLFSNLQGDDNSVELGDGTYNMGDEKFWGTNPNIKSTAGNSQVDEANLIGLNMDKFTWTYQDGDQIGVAVEGKTSDPSIHDDSSYIITWAFSKNSCKKFDDYLDTIDQKDRQFYTEQNKTDSSATSSAFGVLIAENFDVNECLKENFIDPKSGGDEQLKVSLTYSPENPKNIQKDTSGKSLGSVVSVSAAIENAQGSTLDNSFYWKIETSSNGDANPPSWVDVTNEFTLNSQTDGIGNDMFSFKLDAQRTGLNGVFKGSNKDKTYIRVGVMVKESGISKRSGFGKAIIGITNTNKNIEVYRTSIVDEKVKIDGLICSDVEVDKRCSSPVPVVQNEIIGLKFSDEEKVDQIVWTKDGEILTCSESITKDCSNGMHQVIPITGVEGTIIEVAAKVKSVDGTASQDYIRSFEVVKPSVRIFSADTNVAWEKIIGYEKNLDGNMVAISTPDVLKTYFNREHVVLRANFVPDFINEPTYVKYQWVLNGENRDNDPQESTPTQPKLTFTISEEEGPIYSVQINATYSQPTDKRKALQKHWNVSAFDSQDAQLSASVQVEAQREEVPLEVSVARNFFASLISNISTQTLFMIKVLLSGGLFFAATFVIFSVMPNAQYSEKRRN